MSAGSEQRKLAAIIFTDIPISVFVNNRASHSDTPLNSNPGSRTLAAPRSGGRGGGRSQARPGRWRGRCRSRPRRAPWRSRRWCLRSRPVTARAVNRLAREGVPFPERACRTRARGWKPPRWPSCPPDGGNRSLRPEDACCQRGDFQSLAPGRNRSPLEQRPGGVQSVLVS